MVHSVSTDIVILESLNIHGGPMEGEECLERDSHEYL